MAVLSMPSSKTIEKVLASWYFWVGAIGGFKGFNCDHRIHLLMQGEARFIAMQLTT